MSSALFFASAAISLLTGAFLLAQSLHAKRTSLVEAVNHLRNQPGRRRWPSPAIIWEVSAFRNTLGDEAHEFIWPICFALLLFID